jgi:hypothetical protein
MSRSPLRLGLALALLVAAMAVLAIACNYQDTFVWICLNPVTGKEDSSIYDPNSFHNGQPDPCHCYDVCGPSKECPIVVDASAPPADAGCMADGGGSGGGDGG